jgi:hypothetical protein
MKPSPLPPRAPSRLSTALRNQLNMYSLAASAAGVGVLALAQSAEARIVYTKTHHIIRDHSQYLLALTNKTPDFNITNTRCPYANTGCTDNYFAMLNVSGLSRGNAIVGVNGASYLAAALRPGVRISKERRWIGGGLMVSQCQGFCTFSGTRAATIGRWDNVSSRYLGMKFTINGKVHYGWARLSVTNLKGKFRITATLTGYAYETIPDKPIIAGKTEELDVISVSPDDTGITLGKLALGKK